MSALLCSTSCDTFAEPPERNDDFDSEPMLIPNDRSPPDQLPPSLPVATTTAPTTVQQPSPPTTQQAPMATLDDFVDSSEVCGDGLHLGAEREVGGCDDGNTVSGDGCSEGCLVESGYDCPSVGEPCLELKFCRDGRLHPDEPCDPTVEGPRCNWDCTLASNLMFCSDDVIDEGEQCDDGNLRDGDGCDFACRLEPGAVCDAAGEPCGFAVCGNGLLESGERCDDGNLDASDGCSEQCRLEPDCLRDSGQCLTVCGDGLVAYGLEQEECDDGNTTEGDGCDSNCEVEPGFTCQAGNALAAPDAAGVADAGSTGDAAVTAARMDASSTAAGFTPSACTPTCGDGVWTLGEVCDEGEANGDAYDQCGLDCSSHPRCGDGILNGSESCDNGINLEGYAFKATDCAPGCVLPSYCGDAVKDDAFGEACDFGTLNDSQTYGGCTTDCREGPRCGDGEIQDGIKVESGEKLEECDDGNHERGDGCDPDCRKEERFRVP